MPSKSTFIAMRENERENRREILVQKAIELFGRKPYHEIGMRTIAEAAGVSPASIYRYFPSREDLLVEALARDIAEIEILLKKRLETDQSSLEDFALAAVDYLIDNEPMFQMLCHFMTRGEMNPGALEKFNALQRHLLQLWDEVLGKAGIVKNNRLFTHAFVAALLGIVMAYRNYPGRSPAEKRSYIHKLVQVVVKDDRCLPAGTPKDNG